MKVIQTFTMAALEAATQPASDGERKDFSTPADTGALGGRVKPGHGDFMAGD